MSNTDQHGVEWVRVQDTYLPYGNHISLPRGWAEAEPNRYKVLKDHDALDANGRPLPPELEVPEPEPVDPKKARNTDQYGVEWVRVKDALQPDNRHYSVAKNVADADPDRYTVLKDHDALNANGQPLPPKFPTEQPEQPDPEKSQKPAAAAKTAK